MTESRDYFPLSVKILVGAKGLEPPASCSQSRRATNCATPRYIWFFYFVIFAKHSITVRCASLKNIVALLAWSASHCSLVFHLRASPESSAGCGEPLRPTALHPDIFDFLLCQSCEFQYNNPLRFPQKHSRTARLERVALLVVFSPQSFAWIVRRTRRISSPNCATPRYIWFFTLLFCETQHNNPLFARKCIEFRLNA